MKERIRYFSLYLSFMYVLIQKNQFLEPKESNLEPKEPTLGTKGTKRKKQSNYGVGLLNSNSFPLGAVHKGYPTFQLVSRFAKMGYEDI